MKHLKLYSTKLNSFVENKIFENQNFDHIKLKGMIYEYELLCKNIINYLNFIKIDNEIVVIAEMWYANPEHYKNKNMKIPIFCINYRTNTSYDDSLTYNLNEKEYNDLLTFLSDPEVYMSAKKYNL